jgi:4-amino-4-deoxy-L-arabinose transferase-like glycosyltransferase
LALVTSVLFLIRATGPSNLMDNDQERPASYVMDAVLHGNWACQTDWTGDIMSKPPLFTWIAALATLPVGHGNLVSLYAPCFVAILLTVGLLFGFGRRCFSLSAGFLAGLFYLASPAGVKHIALARTDAVFAAAVALTALMGYRAWRAGRGWSWFWLAAALATLTKGPLGLVLGAMGLLAALWERYSGGPTRGPAGSPAAAGRFWLAQLTGLLLFILITGGWFWLAYRHSGQAFIDKVIGRELVGHMVSDEHGTFGIGFVKAPLYWLSRFLPWSLLAGIGLWRVARRPASDPAERRFERFLFCWILGGLLLFSLAKHQRGDLPLPLFAPAALLAGREVADWLRSWHPRQLVRRSLVATVAALALYTVYLHTVYARTWEVRQSEGLELFARELACDSSLPPLLHVDSPYALQFHLNTMNRAVGFEAAAAALIADQPCAVAVSDARRLREAVGETVPLYDWGICPGSERDSTVTLVANRPK